MERLLLASLYKIRKKTHFEGLRPAAGLRSGLKMSRVRNHFLTIKTETLSGPSLLTLLLLWFVSSCSAQILDNRKNDNQRVAPGPGTPAGAGPQTSSPQTTTPADSTASSTVPADPADLPSFLHRRDEALALADGKLVEKYEAPDDTPTALTGTSTAYAAAVSGIDTFLKALFLKPLMQPGRTLQVFAFADESLNASADAYQRVTINAGLLKAKNGPMTISTLCHEMAHSTRNHVFKRSAVADQIYGTPTVTQNPAAKAAVDKLVAYLDRQLVAAAGGGGVYTHKKAEYLLVRQDYDNATKDLAQISRKSESEADIIGGFICAQAGMKSAEFIKGYTDFTAIVTQMQATTRPPTKPEDIADGQVFNLTADQRKDIVGQYLFRVPSHPELKDRDAQLVRIKDLIDKKFDDKIQLYADLVKELARAEGISLVQETPTEEELLKMFNVRTIESVDGETTILLYDPTAGPGHGPPFRFR